MKRAIYLNELVGRMMAFRTPFAQLLFCVKTHDVHTLLIDDGMKFFP